MIYSEKYQITKINCSKSGKELKMKPVVAHLTGQYLPLTETWLYNQIINLKHYEPIVLAQSTMNLDKFPTESVFSIPKRSILSKILDIISIRRTGLYPTRYFEDIIREKNVKLLHAHFGTEGFRYLKLKNKLNLPMITTFYGFDVCQIPRIAYWRKRYVQLFQEGDLFLTEGNNMKQELIKLGCPENKIVVQHLGVDLHKFNFIPRGQPEDGNILVLIAGSFREKKGIPYAIRAFAEVKENHQNIRLRILGDGPMRVQIESLIAELDLSDSATLLGYQSHDVFLNEATNAHIFMLPSITAQDGDTEGGAPVAIIEAQATGMPVISSYHADIPEVVIDGKSAFLAPEKDIETLIKHLEYLVENPDSWYAIGRAGREHVEKEYDLIVQVGKLETIYNRLLQ
jgi:colanic acid/amylovoran biosynthesis glycosyltransferase